MTARYNSSDVPPFHVIPSVPSCHICPLLVSYVSDLLCCCSVQGCRIYLGEALSDEISCGCRSGGNRTTVYHLVVGRRGDVDRETAKRYSLYALQEGLISHNLVPMTAILLTQKIRLSSKTGSMQGE